MANFLSFQKTKFFRPWIDNAWKKSTFPSIIIAIACKNVNLPNCKKLNRFLEINGQDVEKILIFAKNRDS